MLGVACPELQTNSFRDAIRTFIARNGQVDRERLLDAVLGALDDAVHHLLHAGDISIEEDPYGETHLDIIRSAPR